VDMESAAVAQVCRMNEVPWVIVRAISDSAEEDSIAEFRNNLTEVAARAAEVVVTMVSRMQWAAKVDRQGPSRTHEGGS